MLSTTVIVLVLWTQLEYTSAYVYSTLGPANCGSSYEVNEDGLWLSFDGYRSDILRLIQGNGIDCFFHIIVRPNGNRNKLTITIESLETPDPTFDCRTGNFLEVITTYKSEIVCGRWTVYRRSDLRERTNIFADDLGRISLRIHSLQGLTKFRFSIAAVAYADDRFCTEGEFRCWEDNEIRCIDYRFRCNGHYDCGFMTGADEYECLLTGGAIAGVIIGALLVLGIIIGSIIYLCKKRKKNDLDSVISKSTYMSKPRPKFNASEL